MRIILGVSVFMFIFCSPIALANLLGVTDTIVENNTGTQIGRMDTQIKTMTAQLEELRSQTESLQREIKAVNNIRDSDNIRSLLNSANKLIGQSRDLSYSLNKETNFSKNYQGYKTVNELKGSSGNTYDSFYQDNVNATLSTINNANKAIDDVNQQAQNNVNSNMMDIKNDIRNAEGTTEAVSYLAEVNIQTLQQLQSMQTELAAMSEAENAASAKKIQEEAVEKAEARKKLDEDAIPIPVNYGQYPIQSPKLG